MTDVAPELLEAVSGRLQRYMATDKTLGPLVWAIRDGKANYQTVNRYAIRLGELLSDALRREISVDKLPDGRMYYNIAERVLGPLLENNHELVADAAECHERCGGDRHESCSPGTKPQPRGRIDREGIQL